MNTDTSESTSAIHSRVSKGGLFRAADGTRLALTFVLITSLFLLWGFCNGMIDILNKHFQDTLRINKEAVGSGPGGKLSGLLPDGHASRFDCQEVWL